MVAYEADKASICHDGTAGGSNSWALQLLWGKRKFPCNTKFLEIPEILYLPHAEQATPEALDEI